MSILQKNQKIANYTILFFIKKGSTAETYRVKGDDGELYFAKIFLYSSLSATAFAENHNLLEIEILKPLKHDNITTYKDSGEIIIERQKYSYLITDFIVGETLSERISRSPITSLYDIKEIMSGILCGLQYLHNLSNPVIHNEITPHNIMLDLSTDNPLVKIIDFGYARYYFQSNKCYHSEGLTLNYVASECFNNIFSPKSDIFSAGVVLYQLLFHMLPWNKEMSHFQSMANSRQENLLMQRRNEPFFPDISELYFDYDDSILSICRKALQENPEKRFQTCDEFLQAIKGNISVKADTSSEKLVEIQSATSAGIGFAAIAGMEELKAQMKLDVIDALNDPEKYLKYGISIPNGMLLYGPPGCGKTFFAKKFAEEVQSYFMIKTPSDLKSKYVNASQENIAQMFKEAKEHAPTIIFIDEINELLPSRDGEAHEMSISAVNEMLSQMDRTGDSGIFLIGATNFPHKIDSAMLRSGRLDKKFYISPPDQVARKSMFEMYLHNRYIDFGIDYDELARLTENYVSSDIRFIIDEASRQALRENVRISMKILQATIIRNKPSISLSELVKYEAIRQQFEGENRSERKSKPIGFNK